MTLADTERTKYEKIWTFPDYRRNAPGEALVDKAIGRLGLLDSHGATIYDFGCGTGRAAAKLHWMGYRVTGIDHARNCLDPAVKDLFPFYVSNLWELDLSPADYGFCTDVMEHIPEEKVDDTLRSIRVHTTRGTFFQIATRPDSMGRLIGERLHMTVQPAAWWEDKLRAHWGSVEIEAQGRDFIAVCR